MIGQQNTHVPIMLNLSRRIGRNAYYVIFFNHFAPNCVLCFDACRREKHDAVRIIVLRPARLNMTAHRVLQIVILHTDPIHLNQSRVKCDSRLMTPAQFYPVSLSLIVFSCLAAAHNRETTELMTYSTMDFYIEKI